MARVALTGGTGFLGSNVAEVLGDAGHEVLVLTRATPPMEVPWSYAVVNTSDSAAVEAVIGGCDALVHTAIANDFQNLDAQAAYDAYPGLTQSVTRAALAVGAKPIFISTDWVMDGTSHTVPESDYGRPINTYGYLKALSEQVIRDLAPERGVICRIGGVMGSHRLMADMPRNQDVGFGYFVSALVKTLRAGEEFMVFSGAGVNTVATPSLASEIGATLHRIIERDATGVFHVVADDAITREDLAALTCEVFDLDASLVTTGEPPEADRFSEPVPVDTSLDNSRVKAELGVGPVSVRDLLEALRAEADGKLHPVTPVR
jgi:dTDP-4-dehydrorhamnose reductase